MKRLLILALSVAVMAAAGCGAKEPVRIGVSAQFTGKQAELGIQQRNAVLMAVDEINGRGGIHGRPLEVFTEDDQGTPEGAVAADTALLEKGVVCIIGHATSAMTLAGLPVAEEAGVVMMSPTASTSELAGKDDHFIRVIQTLVNRSEGIAVHIHDTAGISRLGLLYDEANQAYSGNYREHFNARYIGQGGAILFDGAFNSSQGEPDFDALIQSAREKGVEGLLLIASDADTAYIAQRVRLMGWEVPLFSSAWAQTDVLLQNGGRAVEGMVLEQSFSMQSQEPDYLSFKQRYRDRFGAEASFSAALGYETLLALEQALLKTRGEKEGLKEALLEVKDLRGLTDSFSIDPYGDVIRPYYLGKIQNGQYVDIDAVKP